MKKLIPLLLVVVLLWGIETGTVSAQDSTDHTWFTKIAAGVVTTTKDAKNLSGESIWSAEVVKRAFGDVNMWLSYRYSDINYVLAGSGATLNDHLIKTMFFGRKPGGDKIAPYVFVGSGFTQTPDDTLKKGDVSVDGGLGLVFPLMDMNWGAELGVKRFGDNWIVAFQLSSWWTSEPKRE